MKPNHFFVDVVLPLALDNVYTYHCSAGDYSRLAKGMRIAVAFGRQKVQTAFVINKHRTQPSFKTQPILEIIDERPVITEKQWELFEFIRRYYITSIGKTLRSAIPSSFLLESRSLLKLITNNVDKNLLDDHEFLVVEALEKEGLLKTEDLFGITGSKSKAFGVINRLIDKGIVGLYYDIKEKYKPKYVTYIDLYDAQADPKAYLDLIAPRAKKQQELFLKFLSRYLPDRHPVLKSELMQLYTHGVLQSLIRKKILKTIEVPADRQVFDEVVPAEITLSDAQQEALDRINDSFRSGKPVLLHGVTASGKTEIYIKLIEDQLKKGNQVLFMLPEIGLTAQLVNRLKKQFGNRTAVYHSKYSTYERREIWMNVLENNEKARLIVGTRSAVFLPFNKLGLIIVDEEHDESYKESQTEPMYQSRDLAMVLKRLHRADVILGSATPSFESLNNVDKSKYDYVKLDEKFHKTPEPEKIVLDFRRAFKEGRVKTDFIKETLEAIEQTVRKGLQVIVFINRRGYAPIITCKTCGYTENCPNCSVSLTYHQHEGKFKCHYCGYQIPKSNICRACGSPELKIIGTGTEKVEAQLKEFFPEFKIARMDSGTMQGKKKAEKLITAFEKGAYDILVGTQMLTKGLDFGKTGLVVVVNADKMIHFPEFKAHERAFQMLVQVSGRTGRRHRKDAVIIQTYQPEHPVITHFLTNDYQNFYQKEMKERRIFKYPPFYKLIKLELLSKNPQNLHKAADWLSKALRYYFKTVLGPSEPPVYKIRNYFYLELLIKLPAGKNTMNARNTIRKIIEKFRGIPLLRNVKVKVNADP